MFRVLALFLGAIAVMVAVVGLVARNLPISNHAVLVLAAASPYLMVAGPVGVLLLAIGRRWILTGVAACLSLVMVASVAPLYVGPEKTTVPSFSLRLLTANLRLGEADPHVVTSMATDWADVLTVQELTPELASGLSSAGLDNVFPHRVIQPGPAQSGVGLWSRYPIVESGRGGEFSSVWARLRIPNVIFDPMVFSVHLTAPWPQPIDGWQHDISNFAAVLRRASDDVGSGAVIAAGDLNTTLDMKPFRQLLEEGYRDAAEQSGAGLTRTYPYRRWRRPLIGLDHVLVRNCVAASAKTVAIAGSDHRGLLSVIDVPLDPTASYPLQ